MAAARAPFCVGPSWQLDAVQPFGPWRACSARAPSGVACDRKCSSLETMPRARRARDNIIGEPRRSWPELERTYEPAPVLRCLLPFLQSATGRRRRPPAPAGWTLGPRTRPPCMVVRGRAPLAQMWGAWGPAGRPSAPSSPRAAAAPFVCQTAVGKISGARSHANEWVWWKALHIGGCVDVVRSLGRFLTDFACALPAHTHSKEVMRGWGCGSTPVPEFQTDRRAVVCIASGVALDRDSAVWP
ncbi:unnamed protein product [Amoebophrya sp. A120]|nr:unnamed protein product [Amoebophrya sp. A120]|eukprot:GSA120T00013746001.1